MRMKKSVRPAHTHTHNNGVTAANVARVKMKWSRIVLEKKKKKEDKYRDRGQDFNRRKKEERNHRRRALCKYVYL